jgi:8-oxo-dGTP diphosphatase
MEKNSPEEIIAAGCLVEKDGKFLLVQEMRDDFYGKWNLPMGRQEPGESLISCAEREGKEETGLDLKVLHLIGKYRFNLPSGQKVKCLIFKAEIKGGGITVPADMLDVKFLSVAEIGELEKKSLVASFVIGAIKDFQSGKSVSGN